MGQQVKIKWTEKNAKEVTKWMLVPGTIELHTSLLKNKFEGSYLEGFETLISNLKSVLTNRILAQSKKLILKNKNWFDRDCMQLKRTYNKEYRKNPAKRKEKALKESWHRLIAAVKTKNTSLFWHITRGLGKSPLPPTNQVPIHAWEEYFRELYTDPDYVTKESQISLDQTPYWSPVTPGEISRAPVTFGDKSHNTQPHARQRTSNSSPPNFHEVFLLWVAKALHIGVFCTIPVPQVRALTPLKGKKALRKPPEKNKFVCQAIKVPNPQQLTGEGILATGLPIIQDADSKGDDPMVSGAIQPFKIERTLTVTRTGIEGPIDIIIDTGSSQCHISPKTVHSLGIETKPLTTSI
ncbi:hypothetical protein E2320_002503 [Naja naja]|nr:hypothetical protein E2320_002503 [Naja naja]